MDFLANLRISKVGNGVIKITTAIEEEHDAQLYILPSGSVVVHTASEQFDKMYESLANYPEKVAYIGEINQETYVPEGRGTIYYHDSLFYTQYQGDVVNGQARGAGKLEYKNGTVEEGVFDGADFRGTKTYPPGNVIRGHWYSDEICMIDTADFTDGRKLFKTKEHESRHFIHGTLLMPGQGTFVGEIWMKSFEPYKGTMTFWDGKVYTGECQCLKHTQYGFNLQGKGTMTLPDGTSYSGEWHMGEIDYEYPGTLTFVGNMAGKITGYPTRGIMSTHLVPQLFSYIIPSLAERRTRAEGGDDVEEDADTQQHADVQEHAEQEQDEEQEQEDEDDDYGLVTWAPLEEDDNEVVAAKLSRTFTRAEDNSPENLHTPIVCGFCNYTSTSTYVTCRDCLVQTYCNAKCRVDHWIAHSAICKISYPR